MSGPSGQKPPLRATRAGQSKPTRARSATKRKPPAKPNRKAKATPQKRVKRTSAKRQPTRRGPIGWLFGGIAAILGYLLGLTWRVTWRLGLAVIVALGIAVAYMASTLPDATELVDGRARGSVTLLDRNGETFAWRGDQFGGMVTAESVSPYLHDAVVATEDKRFYRHFGISPRGIASAIRINLREGRGPLSGHGGSTITQQTAKLLCLGEPYDPDAWESEADYEADCRRTTLWRKAKEAIYAMAMEAKYSKEEILTIYFNRSYLGAGSRGFEAAAQRYFGVPAAELSVSQAAILAGLLKAPSTYAPTRDLETSWARADTVLTLMEDQGYITAEQAASARANPAGLSQAAERRAGGYFADWAMETSPDFLTEDTTEDVIIRTTLDPRIQSAAEQALTHVFETKVRAGSDAQAAIVVMSADGAVRAMVGGRNFKGAGLFNRATQASRQTGSLFKPFVFATALELGHGPYETIDDSRFCMQVTGSGNWCPENYDRTFKGPVTLNQALYESRNVPAVKLSETVGRDNVRSIASEFGVKSSLADGPALALGVSESTLIEMTGAYAGILNGGSAVRPYGVTELRLANDSEPLMGSTGGMRERVVREQVARELTWMMRNVVAQGTGTRARLDGWDVAGKTGTTQAARDAWFIGFTGNYVTGVWMGNDDNTPLKGVTGGGLPADIWRETMSRVLAGQAPVPLPLAQPIPPAPTQIDVNEKELAEQVLENVLMNLLNGTGN